MLVEKKTSGEWFAMKTIRKDAGPHKTEFEEKRAKLYTSELILALGHLHSKDIIFRDLKLKKYFNE